MNEKLRNHMIFRGRVQGVGFRFVANYSAVNIGVTGWVQNLWDGSVEMEVQGTSEQINLLLQQIYESRYIHIEDIEAEKIPLKEESDFRVLDY